MRGIRVWFSSFACLLSPTGGPMSKGLSAILLLVMGLATAQDKPPHKMIQNIAPEEMWSRVKRCLFPAYPELAVKSHIVGTVDIGLAISHDGDVDNTSRVLE